MRIDSRWVRVFSYVLSVIILAILGFLLFSEWQKIKHYEFILRYRFFFLAFIFSVLNIFFLSVVWNFMLKLLCKETKLSVWEAFDIFFLSWIARYIPGKIISVAGKVYLGGLKGMNKRILSLVSVFELFLSLGAHILLGIVSVSIFFDKISYMYPIAFISLVGVGIIIVHPEILSFIINRILKTMNQSPIEKDKFFRYKFSILFVLLYCLVHLLKVIAFMCLAAAIIPINYNQGFIIMASFILAGIIAKLTIIMPGGLGVREGVLAGLLRFSFPTPIAILLSIVSRMWFIFVDAVLFIIVTVINRKLRKNFQE
ncbi:MAG: lysylphosphatidylglycerol synthase domain-containing protein [Candidatus Theseobacter exili]|nr:lysylphosphatidylglycerol synthase domain-containing protein [Candidatus Theseobacter exili]